jgi:hypothetical protein
MEGLAASIGGGGSVVDVAPMGKLWKMTDHRGRTSGV